LCAENRVLAEDQRTFVERLRLEKISLHGVSRAVGIRIVWLMDFIFNRFTVLPEHL
jgi:hypothetical protein